MKKTAIIILIAILLIAAAPQQSGNPPEEPVKLIFIHHSTGRHWLNDGYGNLGQALGENNYFVSDTHYGWGPNNIGDRTDIPNWNEWFASDQTPVYMDALYNETEQNADYARLLSDPGGENEIIMFKSCFPNSDLEGNPDDPPSDYGGMTVGGAKRVYISILEYFSAHPDKLFIAVTAPPLSDPANAENARAFNNWLKNEWLVDYEGTNVAVFDFYDILTGPDGGNTLYYPTDDDHPSGEGSRLATEAFVPQLNAAYQRWQAGDASAPPASEPDPVADTESPPTPATAPSSSILIDDFEGGDPANSYGWEAYKDDASNSQISCVSSSEIVQSGQYAMKIDYEIELYSWATCDLTYENPQNWSDTEGLSFYVYAVQDNTVFNVDLFLENEDYVYVVSSDATEEWIPIYIPWSNFKRVEWEENAGSPFTKPEQINGIAFGFNTPDNTEIAPSGTIYVDNLALGQDSAVSEVPELVPETENEPDEKESSEEKPSGSPIPCVGGFVIPAGIAGLAFERRKKK